MSKDDILHYLNAKSEYTANVNLRNYTDQQWSIFFDEDSVTISTKAIKKKLKYNSFTKKDFDEIFEPSNE